jgi:hypothetical protein
MEISAMLTVPLVTTAWRSNYSSECPVREVQQNQKGSKLNGTHLLLVYSDNVNSLERGNKCHKENTEAILDDSKEICLEQWYSTFFVRVPPDVIFLQLCTPKVVGENSSYT